MGNIFLINIMIVLCFANIGSKIVFGEDINLIQKGKLIKVTEEYVFFRDSNDNLFSMNLDGKNKKIINRNRKYLFYKDWIYYVQSGNRLDSVFKMKFNGSRKEFYLMITIL